MQLKMYRPAECGRPEIIVPEGFTIREMRPGEEIDWSYCCFDSFGVESVSPEHYERMMAHDEGVRMCDVFFVCKDDKPVGTSTARTEKGEPFLHFIAVHPDFRGHKLASPTIAAVINRHMDMGRHGCFLTTDDWRVPAVKSYLNFGYRPVLWSDDARERWEKMLRIYGIERVAAYEADMTPAPDIIA